MLYVKRKLNKILPLALFFGAIGGVLLIIVSNLFVPSQLSILLAYGFIITLSVYVLNRIQFQNELKGSVLCGFCVYLVMTFIAYIDMIMNANPDFVNPIFENITFFTALFTSVLFFSISITFLYKNKIIQ